MSTRRERAKAPNRQTVNQVTSSEMISINKQEKERELIMGVYIGFVVIAIPCIIFLLYCLTPSGKNWLRQNNML